jgi:hypothetical protein
MARNFGLVTGRCGTVTGRLGPWPTLLLLAP